MQTARGYERRRDEEHIRSKGEARKLTKFDYALDKVLKKAARKIDLFTEKQQNINIDFCEEDEKGLILHDERGDLKFKKDTLRQRNAGFQKLGDEEVELQEHIVHTVPPDVTIRERLAFDGLIISVEEPEEEEEEVSGKKEPT